MLLALSFLICFFKKFRFFNSENISSVNQKASSSKLLAVKVGDHKKKSADLAITAEACASVIGPGSSGTGVKSF